MRTPPVSLRGSKFPLLLRTSVNWIRAQPNGLIVNLITSLETLSLHAQSHSEVLGLGLQYGNLGGATTQPTTWPFHSAATQVPQDYRGDREWLRFIKCGQKKFRCLTHSPKLLLHRVPWGPKGFLFLPGTRLTGGCLDPQGPRSPF